MAVFGDKACFSIEYIPTNNRKGFFHFFVDNKDVLEYSLHGETIKKEWDITPIVSWLDSNLMTILAENECPVSVNGDTGIAMYNNCFSLPELQLEQSIDMIQEWGFHHDWIIARGGLFLAEVFFRRLDDKIEISWDNRTLYSSCGLSFMNPIGAKLISIVCFKDVILAFSNYFNGTGDGSASHEENSKNGTGDSPLPQKLTRCSG